MPVTKHTPGPWAHLGMGDIHGHEANGGGVDIAAVYLREDEGKWLANANLIAAAPELLEALQSFPGFTDDAAIGDPWLEQMRAAVAKATGGTPCL